MLRCEINPITIFLHFFFFTVFKIVFLGGWRKLTELCSKVKVTKGAEGKCGGGSKMIKSEVCLCEKGQPCQGFRCLGTQAEFSQIDPASHSCLILWFYFLLYLFNEKQLDI